MNAIQAVRSQAGLPVLKLVKLPIPSVGPGQVLVKLTASEINPSDVVNAKGLFPKTLFPRVLGRDYAGIVQSGPDHLIGREVYGTSGPDQSFTKDGTHAEYVLVEEESIALKPANLSPKQAATIGVPWTTALLTVESTRLKEGQSVVVIGSSGSVGSAAMQIAKARGFKALSAARGSSNDINLSTTSVDKGVETLTNGTGVDAVILCIGDQALFQSGLKALAEGGKLIFITAPREAEPRFTFNPLDLYRKDNSIIGVNSLNRSSLEMARSMNVLRSEFEDGTSIPADTKDMTSVSIEDAVHAYQDLIQGARKKYIILF
jgi:NADPH2:quinone reductase